MTAGKGDKRRPTDEQKFRENFDKIFGKKNENSSSTKRPVAQARPTPTTKTV